MADRPLRWPGRPAQGIAPERIRTDLDAVCGLQRGKPNELIRYTDKFDDPNLPEEMQVTVTLKKVTCGTELTVVQEGVPDVIPPDACYLGWQESLAQLANLVDPEIPD